MRILLAILYLYALPSQANTETTLTFTSDYLYHGVSMSNSSPAIQLNLEKQFESGLYTGVWTSNNKFFSTAEQELDFYAGYSWQYNKQVNLDIGAIHFRFLSDNSQTYLTYNEAYISIQWHENYQYKLSCSPDFPGLDPLKTDQHCVLQFNYSFSPTNSSVNIDFEIDYSHSFAKVNSPWGNGEINNSGYLHTGIYFSKDIGCCSYVFSIEDTWLNDLIPPGGFNTNFSMSYQF